MSYNNQKSSEVIVPESAKLGFTVTRYPDKFRITKIVLSHNQHLTLDNVQMAELIARVWEYCKEHQT